MKTLLTIITALLLAAAAGCATEPVTHVGRAAAPTSAEKASARAFSLSNGITLVVKNTEKEGPVSVQAWVVGGSSTDPAGKSGLMHMMEHMLFAGTALMPQGQAERTIEGMGGRIYAETTRDYSRFGVTIPGAGLKDGHGGGTGPDWERATEVLYDMVSHPSFPADQFEKQRKVVALEINQRGREADKVLLDNFYAMAYRSHPYKYPVTGLDSDRLTLRDVQDCYRRLFVPGNIVVVISGNVTLASVRSVMERTFSKMPKGVLPSFNMADDPKPVIRANKETTMPVKLTYLAVGWRVCGASDADVYALDVLAAALGKGRGSRLPVELMDRKGLAYGVRVELIPQRDDGIMAVFADLLDPENIQLVVDETLRQMNRYKDDRVPEQEITRAINLIEAYQKTSNEQAEGQATSLGYWATVYGNRDPQLYMQNIKKVTSDDVRRVAQKYIGEGNYVLSIIRPDK